MLLVELNFWSTKDDSTTLSSIQNYLEIITQLEESVKVKKFPLLCHTILNSGLSVIGIRDCFRKNKDHVVFTNRNEAYTYFIACVRCVLGVLKINEKLKIFEIQQIDSRSFESFIENQSNELIAVKKEDEKELKSDDLEK